MNGEQRLEVKYQYIVGIKVAFILIVGLHVGRDLGFQAGNIFRTPE
jgi:hypothetical protein